MTTRDLIDAILVLAIVATWLRARAVEADLTALTKRVKLLAEHVGEFGHSVSVVALALQSDRALHVERSKAVHEYMDATMRFMEQTADAVKTLLERSDAL